MKTKTLQFLAVAASVAMLAGCASAPERIRAQITDLTNQKRYADDVHDLEMEIGDTLGNHRGETFSWPLWEMGEICARKYLKKKSYQGLIGYLKKTYDIDLNIKDC